MVKVRDICSGRFIDSTKLVFKNMLLPILHVSFKRWRPFKVKKDVSVKTIKKLSIYTTFFDPP
jgi:hypothetical protein